MGNKIGFHAAADGYKNGDKSTAAGEQSPTAATAKDLFRTFVSAKYAAFGPASAMVFRTSRELAYEAREMCEPSLPDIAAVMTELHFKSDQFMGQWTWVLYEKNEYRY
ncbi:MAG: hypothetical protein IJZ86_01265 [Bacteroides sp.]|nr:hypothetical protein [Bacteroides sp.]